SPESLWHAADLEWQLEKKGVFSRPSAREMSPDARSEIDEEMMRKVMKEFPRTKWADLAAYDLLDNKVCGRWNGETKCPEKETDLFERYAHEHPQSPKAAEALYKAAWRQAVLVDMYKADHQNDKSEKAKRRAMQIAQEISTKYPEGDWKPRAAQLTYALQQGLEISTEGHREARNKNRMHDSLLSILLGIIEGLTEFLPVSSTAHLRIAEALLGIDLGNGFWKMYSIVIQLGAILCLPIYFRTRIVRFFSTFPRGERGDRTALNHPLTLVIIAFVFTAIPALLLTKVIGKHLESLVVMGWSLLIGGIIMWVVDAMFGTPRSGGRFQTERMEEMTTPQAIWIGICQIASAVFPGTSRSMSTIAAGQLVGMSRPA